MKEINIASDNKQTFWLATGKILALLANLAIPLFLTRFLSKDEYGFYSQFNTILYFFVAFFSFGMSTSLYYFFPTAKKDKRRALIFHTFIFLLIFSSLSAIFIYIPAISSFFLGNEALLEYQLIIYILTIVIVLTRITQPLYVVKKDIGISIWFPPLQVVLKAVFIIVIFLITPGIDSVINAIILSSSLLLIVVFFYLKKTLREFDRGVYFDKKIAIRQLEYNLPIGLALAIKSFSQRFDKLISITFLSSGAYASYAVAFFGIPGIQQVYEAISQVTVVNMTKKLSLGKKKEALELYKNMVVKNLSFSIPLILIVGVNAKEVITVLFTREYIDAALLFQIHLIAIVFVMLGEGLILRASGTTKFYSRIFILVAPLIITITYFLVKNYGSYGAMSGALLGTILPRVFIFKKEIKLLDTNLKDFFPWIKIGKLFLISFLFLCPVIVLKYFTDMNIFVLIIISIIYLFTVFFVELKMNIFIIDENKLNSFINKYINFKF